MSINRQTDEIAGLQIGPTSEGMVRLYILGDGIDLPMDFDPEEAEEIAEELRAAAMRARGAGEKPAKDGGRATGHGAGKGSENGPGKGAVKAPKKGGQPAPRQGREGRAPHARGPRR